MREKLIELIQAAVSGCATYWAGLIADHLIANGVTIQKWIPVTERLPKESGHYLVCTVHEFYKTANIEKAHFRSGGFYGNGGHWSNVTHWMPLPKLLKGVE